MPRPPFAERIFAPRAQWAAAAGFLAAAFLMGGGAREDITSLVILRPLAVIAVAYALYRRNPQWLANLGPPFWLLLGLLTWAIFQLIPLPHAIWSALPGRELIAANDLAVGLGEAAREISLAPHKTWNTVFALSVPFAVMLTAANLDTPRADRLQWVVFAGLVLSAVIAALQMLGPPGGPFYFFRITNANNPVGLFSNRNHLAIFFASAVPLVVHAAMAAAAQRSRWPMAVLASTAGIFCLFMLVLMTGSRAGLILFAGALAASAVLLVAMKRERFAGGKRRWALPAAAAGAILTAGGLAILAGSRTTALDRFFDESLADDLRVQILPQLWDMLSAYFPVGAGLGAFEYAYTIFEPRSILRTTYLNHAHNDVLEFVIDGGVVALVLMTAFAAWFFRAGIGAVRSAVRPLERPDNLAFAWIALAVLLAGSVGDYPLRTPALMAYAAFLCAVLHRRIRERRRA